MERISYQEVPAEIFDKLRSIENYLESTTIGMHLLEIIRLRVAQKNGCAYCVDMHYKLLKNEGETELRLSSLCVWEETTYFTDKERSVLKFTDTLTEVVNNTLISNDVFTPLLTFFSKEEICYLSLAISQINTWTRLMKTFQFTPGNFKINS